MNIILKIERTDFYDKKITGIILSLMLILSMFSVSAFAADTLADAKQAAISELEAALETALCDEAKTYYNDGIPEINKAESIDEANINRATVNVPLLRNISVSVKTVGAPVT